MEEVDKIIIHSLKLLGCNIEEDTVTLREFTVEMVVESAAKCLLKINDQLDIPTVLPQSMSTRFRVGATLATACKDLGFQGEIGYQTFLYANEHELRRVFMFLIEKLPKETGDTLDEALGQGVLLNNRIAAEIKKQLSVPWTPSYCKKGNVCEIDSSNWFFQGCSTFHGMNTCALSYPTGTTNPKKSKEERKTMSQLPFVTSQPKSSEFIHSSLHEENVLAAALENEWDLEWNQMGMASRLSKEEYKKRKREKLMKKVKEKICLSVQSSLPTSKSTSTGLTELLHNMTIEDPPTIEKEIRETKFTRVENLLFSKEKEIEGEKEAGEVTLKREEIDQEETEEERQQKREQELIELRKTLSNLTQSFQNIQTEVKQVTAQKEQINEMRSSLEKTNKEQEASYKVKRRTVDLLPDADDNLTKLEELIKESSKRLVNLNEQWEKHRAPLIEQYRQLKEQRSQQVSDVESKIEQIRLLRERMKTVADETRSKEELSKQLTEEYERMRKDSNRSAYTKRILEIVGNIKKQKEQISKVLLDTKSLQKEINFLSGKLERTFTVTDELIFRDAKTNEFSRRSYKLLASLHEGFSNLVQTVEDTGVIMREIRDLEVQLDNMNEDEIDENLKKISKDLEQIKKENSELISKYKKARK